MILSYNLNVYRYGRACGLKVHKIIFEILSDRSYGDLKRRIMIHNVMAVVEYPQHNVIILLWSSGAIKRGHEEVPSVV